jgi:hypothetical protein
MTTNVLNVAQDTEDIAMQLAFLNLDDDDEEDYQPRKSLTLEQILNGQAFKEESKQVESKNNDSDDDNFFESIKNKNKAAKKEKILKNIEGLDQNELLLDINKNIYDDSIS